MTDDLTARIAGLTSEDRARLEAAIAARAPGRTEPRTGPTPMSPTQERVWRHARITATPSLYHRLFALRLDGALDTAALHAALNDLVFRHPGLRTRFQDTVDGPRQEIAAAYEVELAVAGSGAVADHVAAVLDAPFDLEAGRVLRARLVRVAANRHLLLLGVHHLVADGGSDRILSEDLLERYAARLRGAADLAAPEPAHHLDFAVSARERASDPEAARYWRAALAAPPRVRPATDRPRPAVLSGRGSTVLLDVPQDTERLARDLAGRVGVTPYAIWLSAYLVALREHSGIGDDVIVGVAASGRPSAHRDRLVALTATTLPLRCAARADLSFAELAAHVHQATREALRRQDLPGDLTADRTLSGTDLVPIGCSYQDFGLAPLSAPGLTARPVRLATGTAKTELTLYLWRDPAGTVLGLEYSTDLFTEATAAALARRTVDLLAAAATDPAAAIRLLVDDGTEAERLHRRSNLTRNQLLIWMDEQVRGGTGRYTIAVAHDLEGPIDPDRFAAAVARTVAESDALRTRITVRDGAPWQETGAAGDRHCFLDLSAGPEPRTEAERRCADLARRPVPLDGPLFSSLLLKTGADRHTWLLRCHHVVFDGWSAKVVFDRVQHHYRSAPNAAPVPAFADHVRAERAFARTRRHRRSGAHWQDRLASQRQDATAPQRAATERTELSLGPERTAALRHFAAAIAPGAVEVATLRLLIVALQVWWSSATGRSELALGVPLHNRRDPSARATIGLFMGVCPLVLDRRADDTFTELLARAGAELSGALRHARYTIADPMGRRSFEVLLNYQTIGEDRFLGRPFTVRWLDSGATDEMLTVQIDDFDRSGALRVRLDFRVDALDPRLRREAPQQLLAVVDALLAGPDGLVDDTDLLTTRQRAELASFNDTAVDFGPFRPVHRIFADIARRHPGRVAVVDPTGTTTYGDLDRRSDALARRLHAAGTAPGTAVAVYTHRGPDLVAAVLGILKAGAAYVPFDPEFGPARFRRAAEAGGLGAVVTDPAEAAEAARAGVPVLLLGDDDTDAAADAALPEVAAADLAYIVHTSGSTGEAKGCMVEHGGLFNAFKSWERAFALTGRSERHLQTASHAFDVFSGDLVRALCSGGTLVICPRTVLLDPPALLDAVRRTAPTHGELVPAVLRPLAREALRTGRPMDGWKVLIAGSESWTGRDHRLLAEACTGSRRLFNTFGLSETTVDTTCAEPGPDLDDATVDIGAPLSNQRVHLLDAALRPVPPGAVGEVYVAGAGVGRGYWGRPAATAERYLPDPGAAGARMYRTGDVARLGPRGGLEFLGRRDGQLSLRGLRIEPTEIEARLRECDGVRDAAVAVATVNGADALTAFVVAAAPGPTVDQIRAGLADRLPRNLVPTRFVSVPGLPATPSGKRDRAALPDPARCPELPSAAYVPPAADQERRIARIWCELLDRDRVGGHDNFFELGGHSLLLIRLKERLSAAFGRDVAVADLFAHPTVASMARRLSGTDDPAPAPPRPDPGRLRAQRRRRRHSKGEV